MHSKRAKAASNFLDLAQFWEPSSPSAGAAAASFGGGGGAGRLPARRAAARRSPSPIRSPKSRRQRHVWFT